LSGRRSEKRDISKLRALRGIWGFLLRFQRGRTRTSSGLRRGFLTRPEAAAKLPRSGRGMRAPTRPRWGSPP
jgi:hypothetical protein